jgi:2-haloacid dehalogenase/putative hydrolase of the HAD superfamily
MGGMPLPKTITFVSFDVYGTLIDWETGILNAFKKQAVADGFDLDPSVVLPLFHEVQREIQSGSYELYAEVLRRTALEIAERLEWKLDSSKSSFLPDSIPYWKPFKEAPVQLRKFSKKYKTGLVSNIDDKLLGMTRRHIPHDFDLVVTAQQVRSYKPDPAHFKEIERRIGTKKGMIHIGSSYYHDVEPCLKLKIPVIWLNRHDEELEGRKKPTETVKTLLDASKLLGL